MLEESQGLKSNFTSWGQTPAAEGSGDGEWSSILQGSEDTSPWRQPAGELPDLCETGAPELLPENVLLCISLVNLTEN